jgi:hypothetical protein
MFIEIKDYLIPVKEISYIRRIGWGLRVVMGPSTIDIIDVSDEEYDTIKWKLCGTPWKPEDALTTVEEVESMKLCNRKNCFPCENYEFISNKVDTTEPGIHVCKMMNKELLDDIEAYPTPYNFFKSEYHYKEEEK